MVLTSRTQVHGTCGIVEKPNVNTQVPDACYFKFVVRHRDSLGLPQVIFFLHAA